MPRISSLPLLQRFLLLPQPNKKSDQLHGRLANRRPRLVYVVGSSDERNPSLCLDQQQHQGVKQSPSAEAPRTLTDNTLTPRARWLSAFRSSFVLPDFKPLWLSNISFKETEIDFW